MGLESAQFVSQLVPTNPPLSDQEAQGANHLQLIKSVLQNTFPGASRACPIPTTSTQVASFGIAATDQNKTILISTASGAVTATLPTLGAGDAGWMIWLLKTSSDANPILITPPSGTIQSGEYAGLAATRRAIPGRRTQILWTGTAFIAERVERTPIGTLLDYSLATLPPGYEWPDGTTLSAANYPDYFKANGNSGVKVDMRAQTAAAPDNFGTGARGIWAAAVVGARLGEVTHQLSLAEIPGHTHTFSGTTSGQSVDHTHTTSNGQSFVTTGTSAGAGTNAGIATMGSTSGASADHTHTYSGTTSAIGSNGFHNIVQLTAIVNKILVVE